MDVVKKICKKKDVLMYCVNGKIYWLGDNYLAIATKKEKKIYEEYIAELWRLKNIKYELNKNDVEKVVDLFNIIIKKGTEKVPNNSNREMFELLKEGINENIESQLENYKRVMDYRDGVLYRKYNN